MDNVSRWGKIAVESSLDFCFLCGNVEEKIRIPKNSGLIMLTAIVSGE